jgi:biopolymer transport protein ExbB
VVLLPASSSLALAAGGASTIAFWIKPTAADADAVLYARHDGGRVLQIGLNKGAPYVAIGNAGAAPTQTSPGLPLGEKAWHQLAVTTGAKVTLFVDGQEKATLELPAPALNAAASLGGDAAAGEGGAVGPIASAYTGELDELEISKSARDPSYLQLLAANQGAGNKLVSFGPDQQLSSWSSGYVGIILRSVTFDGWVVIAILIVMAVLSWVVMFLKARQISRAADGNHAFMKLFRRLGGDFSALNHAVAGAPSNELRDSERVLVQNAPLFRMFGAGVNELRNRASSEGNDSNRTTPSAASLDAIRASLDASLVDELDAFDDRMVILTIAISGGPFLGLLGTVVGVMITFAAIAASGDVNVNSIAPGIAAALVATVAGLLVAIPALFGYNYLMSRIRRMSAQMQVFVDTFITRSTESYGRDTGNGPIASLHPSPAARPTIVR